MPHYKNNKLAQRGDFVVTKAYDGSPVAGIVVTITEGADTCNLTILPVNPEKTCATAKDCILLEDALAIEIASDAVPRPSDTGLSQGSAPGPAQSAATGPSTPADTAEAAPPQAS